jgi:hypothetical protein
MEYKVHTLFLHAAMDFGKHEQNSTPSSRTTPKDVILPPQLLTYPNLCRPQRICQSSKDLLAFQTPKPKYVEELNSQTGEGGMCDK